jgi:hypothetical protein
VWEKCGNYSVGKKSGELFGGKNEWKYKCVKLFAGKCWEERVRNFKVGQETHNMTQCEIPQSGPLEGIMRKTWDTY